MKSKPSKNALMFAGLMTDKGVLSHEAKYYGMASASACVWPFDDSQRGAWEITGADQNQK